MCYFKKLKKTNKDIYAWIDVPGTKVNYAVVQSSGKKDDLFYLEHNIYGNYEFSGSIFSQRQNSKNFSDPVTVLYGHNRTDKKGKSAQCLTLCINLRTKISLRNIQKFTFTLQRGFWNTLLFPPTHLTTGIF